MKTRLTVVLWVLAVLAGVVLPGTPALAKLPVCNPDLMAVHCAKAMAAGLCDDNPLGIVVSGNDARIGTNTCVRSQEDQLGFATRCQDLMEHATAGTMAPGDVPFYEVDANLAIGRQIVPGELAGYEGKERKRSIAVFGLAGIVVALLTVIATKLQLFK